MYKIHRIDYFNIRNFAPITIIMAYTLVRFSFGKTVKTIQFRIAIASIMTKDVRMVLSPLLMMNYVLGLRMTEFSADQSKLCFLYMLLVWLIYCSALIYTVIPQMLDTIEYRILMLSSIVVTLISTAVEAYQDQVGEYRTLLKSCMNMVNHALFLRVRDSETVWRNSLYSTTR